MVNTNGVGGKMRNKEIAKNSEKSNNQKKRKKERTGRSEK